MIMWQRAKRAVSNDTAKRIADVARAHGAQAVGVFVDEDASTILDRCNQCGITIAQLHGDGARAGLQVLRGAGLQVVYVQHVTPEGSVQTAMPEGPVDWVLLDGLQGGSGVALDWTRLQAPTYASKGWLLAGGLNPNNVATALKLSQPAVVDVSSGVCGPDGLRKDASKIRDFVAGVKQAPVSR
uniref:phosphoribosylanthranilate isomerase n=1 Tax=Dunaliella tertiolecta TaxID=3047 RepID=A0A7S3QTV4_DUNTE